MWIIGEYADRIDNADELLETFLDTFPEETSMVRGGMGGGGAGGSCLVRGGRGGPSCSPLL